MHSNTYWGNIKKFSHLTWHIQNPVKHSHIHSLGIFRTGGIFKNLLNFGHAYSKPCNSQNSLFRNYSVIGIFRTLRNPRICRNLAYSEPFHNYILMPIQNPVIYTKIGKPCITLGDYNPGILTNLEYPEPWHI